MGKPVSDGVPPTSSGSLDDPLLDRLERGYSAVAADALDRLGLRNQVFHPSIRPLFPEARLVGRTFPIVIEATNEIPEEPYAGEMEVLQRLSRGDVAVFAVDSHSNAAAWGELFSCAAIARGVRGVIVDGYIRDASQIIELGFPVFSAGCSPLDTLGRALVTEFGTQADCGGVVVRHGDFVIGDHDGIVLIPRVHIGVVLGEIESKVRVESVAREKLLAGTSIKDVWEEYGVF